MLTAYECVKEVVEYLEPFQCSNNELKINCSFMFQDTVLIRSEVERNGKSWIFFVITIFIRTYLQIFSNECYTSQLQVSCTLYIVLNKTKYLERF